MPRCVEPQTPRSPREAEHEPVVSATLDTNIVGGELKERLLSIVQGQYNALQQQLETQHDLLVDAIDELLMISPDSRTFGRDTAESNLPRTADDAKPLLVTPSSSLPPLLMTPSCLRQPPRQDFSMCDMAHSERFESINHDVNASYVSEPANAVHKLKAGVTKVADWTIPKASRSSVASSFLHLDRNLDHMFERIKKHVHAGERIMERVGGSRKFDAVIGVVILANSIVLAIQLQWQGWEAGVQLGFNQDEKSSIDVKHVCFIFEHIFNAIFFSELILRLSIFRLGYFTDLSNIFDASLVTVTSIELYILHPLKKSLGGNVSFLRIFRLAKLVRVLRMVRVLKLFRNLRILVQTIAASAQALLWSMILISVIIILGGIFMCQMLLPIVTNNAKDETTRKWAWNLYGTATRSMYTMFEATLSGCWPNYVRPLVENFSPWYAVVFVVYITGVNFAVIRIIAAIFLRETLNVANNDADLVVQEQRHSKKRYIEKLKAFFKEADSSGDGLIDYQEFETVLQNPKVRTWLACLELEVHEPQALFHMLDDGDGLITYDEFLKGALRLKGHARSIDIIAIMHDMLRLQRQLETLQDLVLFSMPRTGRAQAEEYLKAKQTRSEHMKPDADDADELQP